MRGKVVGGLCFHLGWQHLASVPCEDCEPSIRALLGVRTYPHKEKS